MVRKIEKTPGSGSPARPIEPGKAVETTGVNTVGQVSNVDRQIQAARARRPTRPMTAAEREQLFKLIHEEADKMVASQALPESKRETVEGAVRMAIAAGAVDDEEEKKK